MEAPQAIKNHPNATVAALSIPLSVVVAWFVTNVLHQALSTEEGSAMGGIAASVTVALGRFVKIAAIAVATYGLIGICKILMRGKPAQQ